MEADPAHRTSMRRPPRRTTVALGAWVTPNTKAQAERDARAAGYLTLSSYIADLVANGPPGADDEREGTVPSPLPSVALAALPALLGNRCVMGLEEVNRRIATGDRDLAGIQAELVALRKDVTQALLALRPAFDADMDRRGEAPWDGKH